MFRIVTRSRAPRGNVERSGRTTPRPMQIGSPDPLGLILIFARGGLRGRLRGRLRGGLRGQMLGRFFSYKKKENVKMVPGAA